MRIINADLLMLEIRSLVQKAYDAGRKRGREEAMHESQNVMGSFDDVDFEVDDGKMLGTNLNGISKRNSTGETT
jgi:hypothetical protein